MTAAATLNTNPRRFVGGSGRVAKEVIAEGEADVVNSMGGLRLGTRTRV